MSRRFANGCDVYHVRRNNRNAKYARIIYVYYETTALRRIVYQIKISPIFYARLYKIYVFMRFRFQKSTTQCLTVVRETTFLR